MEKLVLVRIADRVYRDTDVAVISTEELAADCGLTEPGLRGILMRLRAPFSCAEHSAIRAAWPGCCVACRIDLVGTGCVRIARDHTATRARRYQIELTQLRGQAGYPLTEQESLFAEGNPITPREQPGFPLEGNVVALWGETGLPRSGSPAFVPDGTEERGAVAPASSRLAQTAGKKKPARSGATGAPNAADYDIAARRKHG